MRKSATTMTDFVANSRQRSGFDRCRFAVLGREVEQRAETAKPINRFQIACVPEVQPGGSGKWKVGENGEDPRRPGGSRWAGLIYR